MSLHLYFVGLADITRAEYSEAAIYNSERCEREQESERGICLFFSNVGTQKVSSSSIIIRTIREGVRGLRIKDATVSNKEVAV